MYSGLSNNSIYYVSVAEALELPPDGLHAAKIFGTVSDSTITELPGKAGVSFTLIDSADKSKEMHVVYKGDVSDTFKAGAEVYVEGKLNNANAEFAAVTLVTQCPSKYQKSNRT